MKPGYSLMLLSSIAGRAIPITVSADAEAGATTLPIEAASVSGGVGDAVILDGVQLAAWLLITPDRIVEVVEERRKEHAVATLSGEVTGTSVTSLPVTATKSALLDAMDLALTAPNGEKVLKVTINAAGGVAKASTAIPINAANFDAIGGMPAGSTVEQAGFHSAGQHKVASDQIQQRVTIDHSRETWRRELEAKAIATTTATSSGSTLTVSPLVEAIEAGTLVSVLVPVPLPGTGSAYYDTFHRTVQSAAATSATSLVLSASVAANQTPAYVLLRDTSILTKLIAQLASITVNAGDITSLVAQYEGRKIADVNASYGSGTTPATNQTSLSLTGLNEIIEKYDALLIFNLANKRWWEVTANAKLTGNGGSQALTIVSTSLRADPGDPIIRGTMSQLRQDLLGFTMHGKFFKTTGFGGTVDDEGNITAVGSSPGFALGGGGDFAFVQDGDNYVYFDGSDLVVRLGGGGIRINNAGGIEIDGETGKFSGASLDWFDDIDGVKDRVFSIGTQVDLGVILGAYLETQEGLALTLQSDSDISLIAGTDGVITLSALSGTGHIHINPDRLKFFSGTGAVAKPTVTGSRGGNAALSSLLTALSDLGLITDSTT